MAELVEDHADLLLDKENLEHDLQNALNLSELQRRRFRAKLQKNKQPIKSEQVFRI